MVYKVLATQITRVLLSTLLVAMLTGITHATPTAEPARTEKYTNSKQTGNPATTPLTSGLVLLYDGSGNLVPAPGCSYHDGHTYDEHGICFGLVDPSNYGIYSITDGSLLGYVIPSADPQ